MKKNEIFSKEKFKTIYNFFEKIFNKEITKEDFYWHIFLLISGIFLFIIVLIEFFLPEIHHHYHELIRKIEVVFGIIFLFELVMRIFFAFLSKSVYFKWHMILNAFIIISLIVPNAIGNLAILRIIRSLKIVKIYHLKKDTKRLKKWKNN